MKAIFREYGKMILVVCVGMILILLASGMLMVAAQREEPLGIENFSQYQDGLFTRQLYTRPLPEITWIGGSVSSGNMQDLSACFQAEDADGVQIPVTILSVCDSRGNQCQDIFNSAGVYQITVTATDHLGKTATVLVDVPVNGR
ncbi:MAG: PKD domain-containing protein [Roseburia sp.]